MITNRCLSYLSSKPRRLTDSPMSEANMSSRSESTIDRDQPSANGALAGASTTNLQASPHRQQQYSYYAAQPQAFKGKHECNKLNLYNKKDVYGFTLFWLHANTCILMF